MPGHSHRDAGPESDPVFAAKTPQERGGRKPTPQNTVNRNKASECIVCGHVGPRRGRKPVWDENGVGWTECDKGCEPPDGFPVDVTCVPCHPGERTKSIHSQELVATFFSDEDDTDADGDEHGTHNVQDADLDESPKDSQPTGHEGPALTSRRILTRRWTPEPRGGTPYERR